MTKTISRLLMVITIFIALSATSCKKDKFDEPAGNTKDPNLDTISIARLKAFYRSGSPITITDDVTIAGIVIGDDQSGNIYKSIVIDDGNQGIAISIDVSSGLYTDFPVGRKIYVKCKGLALGTYGGTPQLGGYVDGTSVGRIAQALIPKYFVKGPTGNDVTPLIQHITFAQLNATYLSRLVQFDNVEFDAASADMPYADVDASIPDVGDRYIKECSGFVQVDVRSSAFANFAFIKTPKGKGNIVGIYSEYNGDPQLTIRDTSDVNLRGIKCDGTNPDDTISGDYISISTLRSKYTITSGVQVLGTAYKIRGIVISDKENVNENSKNLIIQDGTAGIIVRFANNHTFSVGDDITIAFAATDSLKLFSGALQVGGLTPLNFAKKIGTGTILPQVVTISELNANFYNYESELIKILNVNLTENPGGSNTTGTYGYSRLYANDITGNIQLFTASTALFKTSLYPTGTITSIVAYAVPFVNSFTGNLTREIKIRNTADVTP